MKWHQVAMSIVSTMCLHGCTVVHVSGADATVSRSYLGVANVHVVPRQGQAVLVSTEAAGFVAGAHATNVGWMQETLVMSDDLSACRAYVVVEKNSELEQLKAALESLNNICVFTKEGQSWSSQP